MNRIEKMMSNYPDIYFEFERMPNNKLGGLNIGDMIIINSNYDEQKQYEWLCEELSHYELSCGDITDYSIEKNMWQENKARKRGMKKCVPKYLLDKIVKDYPENDYEVADEIGVQIDYLHKVASMYGYRYR